MVIELERVFRGRNTYDLRKVHHNKESDQIIYNIPNIQKDELIDLYYDIAKELRL
jgi:hypothetical protein